MKKLSIDTKLVHAGEPQPERLGRPNVTPLYTATTYSYSSMEEADAVFTGELDDHIYVRYGNPTVRAFQDAVAELENAAVARAYASGMAALHASLLACDLSNGATVVASEHLYGATFDLILKVFGPLGVKLKTADLGDIDALIGLVNDVRPAAIIGETISNPLLHILDVEAVAEIAHSVGAKFIVDSTFATPFLSRPLDHGADLVVHSATKYFSGSADSIGGVVAAKNAEDATALTEVMKLAGGILSVWEANNLLRGLRTLGIRVERQCGNAAALAEKLAGHDAIAEVHYPTKNSAELSEKYLDRGLGGALVTIRLEDDSREAAYRFLNSLELCKRATSLGDVFTGLSHPASSSHRELPESRRRKIGISEGLIRISVGIESVEDIFADLDQALRRRA